MNKIKSTGNKYFIRNVVVLASILVILAILAFLFLDIYTKHGEEYKVPNFSGMSIEEAQEASKDFNARLVIIDSLFIPTQKAGVILEQNPLPGSPVKSNRRILLTTNTMNPKQVELIYVTGYSLRQAKNRLLGAGFEISKISYKEDIATNNVIEQYFKGKKVEKGDRLMIDLGSSVELVVGLSDSLKTVQVPNLVGLSISDAKNMIWENGFNIKPINLPNDITMDNIGSAKVFTQTPLSYIEMPLGTEIEVGVTLDIAQVSAMTRKLIARKSTLAKIDELLTGYKDTLDILRTKKGKNSINTKHGVITALDSLYYVNKIEQINLEKSEILNDIDYSVNSKKQKNSR